MAGPRYPSIDPTDPASWPERCPDCGEPLRLTRQCMGHKDDPETGERRHCGKHACRGQLYCRSHGGAAPQAKAAAERRLREAVAVQAVATYGLPVEVEPHDALLQELHRTAGHVEWLGALVARLEHEEPVGASVLGKPNHRDEAEPRSARSGLKQYSRDKSLTWEKPSVWVDLYQAERKHLTAVAKACVDAGVAEERVRLAKEQGQLIAEVVRAVVTGLGHELDDPGVREVVVPALRLVPRSAA